MCSYQKSSRFSKIKRDPLNSGKLKTIRVMATRKGMTVQDLDKVLDDIFDTLGDMATMIEREGKDAYGR
jgi:hypothetical protein